MAEHPPLDRLTYFAIAMERSMVMRDRGFEQAACALRMIGDLVVNGLDEQAAELIRELDEELASSPGHPPVLLPDLADLPSAEPDEVGDCDAGS